MFFSIYNSSKCVVICQLKVFKICYYKPKEIYPIQFKMCSSKLKDIYNSQFKMCLLQFEIDCWNSNQRGETLPLSNQYFCPEMVICFVWLLHIFQCALEYFNQICKHYEAWLEQSDLDPYCFQYRLPKYISRLEQMPIVLTGGLRVKARIFILVDWQTLLL